MRTVVHLTDSASRQGGGVFESVRGFAHALPARGWRVVVAASEDIDFRQDCDRWGETPVLLVKPRRADLLCRDLSRAAASAEPAIVHVHGLWGPAARAAWGLVKLRPELKLVVSPHGMLEAWAMRQSRVKKFVGWRAWGRSLLDRADVVHALCVPERNAIEAVLPGKVVCIIANGIDLPDLAGANPNVERPVLLYLGRLHPKKGLTALLEAWSRLEGPLPTWRLVIAGWDDGGHQDVLKAEAKRLGLGERVTFCGPVFGADKDKIMRGASAFVLPSYSEGLPMAVLEAWSYALPVLMTDACNLPEGFQAGAAIKIDPHPDRLAKYLKDALRGLSGEGLRSIGARGRVLAAERFVWENVGADLGRIYDGLISDEPRRTALTR